jgi:ABC-type uncharacterized transport system involved in gliding motility auxiliary subunit
MFFLFFYVNFSKIREFTARRSTKYGVNMAFMITVFFVIIVLIGMMSVKYKVRVDLTNSKRFTLSQQTIKILKSLKRDVEAISFYRSDERTRQEMFDLMKEYAYYSPRFKFWFVDPDRKPAEAAKYGVTSYRTTLIRSAGKEEIVAFESEEKVTNTLLKVIRDEVKVIYFVKGHGENSVEDSQKGGYKAAKESIEKEHHEVKELLLMGVDTIPQEASLLVVSGPKKDLLQGEIERLTDYVNKGGKVLFMVDPGDTPALSHFLTEYGFELGDNIIVDKLSQIFGANYLTPVVTDYHKEHPLTREFNIATFFPVARSVEIKEDPAKGSYNLAMTSSSSWMVTGMDSLKGDEIEFDAERDIRGPASVAAVTAIEVKGDVEAETEIEVKGDVEAETEIEVKGDVEAETAAGVIKESVKKWGKVIVVGDSDFANNTNINLAGNRDIFLNMVNWLNEETDLISIRKRESYSTPLTLTVTQGRLAFWLPVVIVPSLIIVIGVGVMTRRRWGE